MKRKCLLKQSSKSACTETSDEVADTRTKIDFCNRPLSATCDEK